MKILSNNIISEASISSLNENPLYPLTNLQDRYIRNSFEASDSSDTITLEWDSDQITNCVFWGNTNLSNMLVKFLDSEDNIVELVYFSGGNVAHYYGYPDDNYYGYADGDYYGYYDRVSEHVYDPVSWFFGSNITFRKVEITLENSDSENLYLGGLAFGLADTFPDPVQDISPGLSDASISSIADAGQTQSMYYEPMRTFSLNFNVNHAEMLIMRNWYIGLGKGVILWADISEKNHDFFTPIYSVLLSLADFKKSGDRYTSTLKIKEAR